MQKSIPGIFILLLAMVACNLPSNTSPTSTPTPSPAPVVEAGSATSTTSSDTPTPSTPQDPLVLRTTLCWQGPGQKYFVVSSLNSGERVKLLGLGSIPGWYIIENPTYHDLCWVAEADLQVDPSVDLTSLKIYNPPVPKPTKTPKPKPTPTP